MDSVPDICSKSVSLTSLSQQDFDSKFGTGLSPRRPSWISALSKRGGLAWSNTLQTNGHRSVSFINVKNQTKASQVGAAPGLPRGSLDSMGAPPGPPGGSMGTTPGGSIGTTPGTTPGPYVLEMLTVNGLNGSSRDHKSKDKAAERNHSGGTVILNVGGSIHQVRWETIDKFPNSRLQKLRYATTEAEILSICDSFSLVNREFFFDRSPRIFENILGLYRKGELHLTASVCPRDFIGELQYWGLSALHLEPCCAYTLQRASWLLPIVNHGVDADEKVNIFEGMCCAKIRIVLWDLFEDPNSSTAAKILMIVSSLFLLASILMLILATLPEFQSGQKEEGDKNVGDNEFFEITEAIFVGWFTIEYAVRFLVAPMKVDFIFSFLNIIDLCGILPFYTSLILNRISDTYSLEYIAKAAQIFRILRILRIFKLSRHITGLKTLGTTLRNSHRELLLLSMTVSMGMLIFAGLGYALEKDEPDTMFYTLPQTLYWAIITMTSTGYGDIAPKTAPGKFVASLCAICGVLCITLPIPIIVANFNRFHDKARLEEELEDQKKENIDIWEETKKHLKYARALRRRNTHSDTTQTFISFGNNSDYELNDFGPNSYRESHVVKPRDSFG